MLVVCTGIGQGRVTNNVKGAPIDYAHLILDTEAVAMVILYAIFPTRGLSGSSLV